MRKKKVNKKPVTSVKGFFRDLFLIDRKLWVPIVIVFFTSLFISQGFIRDVASQGTVFGIKTDPFEKPVVSSSPISVPDPALYPKKTTDVAAPDVSADSAIVMDVSSQVVMYEKNSDVRFPSASTTKIMTALVGLDQFGLADVLTAPLLPVEGAKMKLVAGEQIAFENMLYGLLLASGNDAAVAIAYNSPGGIDGFVDEMNKKAAELNLVNTYFADPTGLSSEDYTTALDLSRLASFALKNETLAKIFSTREKTVTDITGSFVHPLENLNKLLGSVVGAAGVKTGYTEEAGQVLVAAAIREGHTIVTVVLKSQDRFLDSKNLLEWAFTNHRFTPPTLL